MKLLNGMTFEQVAVERLREHEHAACERDPDGYYVAHSGGKDSVVIWELVKRAGVRARAVHHLTTCDPPELVRFVKSLPDVRIESPPESMWSLIRRKGMPPRRNARFCCAVLKEGGGKDSVVVTGVRWAESTRRSKRQMVEPCYRGKGRRTFLHPIIDWTSSDVWAYIRERDVPYCSLYDEGFARIGCVLCPMNGDTYTAMRRWPKICAHWERAIKATWKPKGRRGFDSPDALWRWWLDRRASCRANDQPTLFDDAGTEI